MKFKLPELRHSFDAYEPHIDAKTMEIHHGKHHNGYVEKLNAALEVQKDLESWDIQDLLKNLEKLPKDIQTAVRNNGGGHYNHTLFWAILSPEEVEPGEDFKKAIEDAFGSMENFKNDFKDAALKRFGSGWAWLVMDQGELKITSTPNQDSPISNGQIELLGLDVWEHAYYLNYQNRRPDYVDAFWNVVDWSRVESRWEKAK
ncbi:superoxide dismutase [Isachenkonia alkalipeptolytica]|uniref:Superoxide dismutase n=1 Tax=Isachenkonia alkalipeptolytica TaxID=2565777 RepID=A0AA44BDL0_9CLOT|nr:superoxide dismutase [Isachenkonia alkalipeptolytica]NBG88424.1 superoxide dismutase [Isachenkonia alkalipeptolytica]